MINTLKLLLYSSVLVALPPVFNFFNSEEVQNFSFEISNKNRSQFYHSTILNGNQPDLILNSDNALNEIKSDSHYIIDDLPAGFVKNGTVDYTRYIQKAIDQYSNLVFPSFPLLINDTGLKIRSNSTLTFLKGSEIRLKPSMKKTYNIINLREVSNVTLNNPVIKGDRYSHLGTDGEFGMGIAIRGGKNINIINPKITECWGDGIYIGQTKEDFVPKNILIRGAYLSKNRRDGISIISVDGLILENIYASYQDGTKPMCGINFEPNNSDCEINNVKIINPKTEFNNGSGIQLVLSNLFGNRDKNVNIQVINHVDLSSKSFAFKVACNNKGKVRGKVLGQIAIINPSWNATIGNRPLAFVTDQPNLRVKILSPKVKKANGIGLNSSEVRAILNKHSNGDLKIL